MTSIQWQYQPTPDEIKKSKLVPRILGFSFHFSGVIYLLIYYFGDIQKLSFGIALAVAYVVGLLFWHLYLKKILVLGRMAYTINDAGLEIMSFVTNKTKSYKWEELKSFSDNIMDYYTPENKDPKPIDIKPSKFFHILQKEETKSQMLNLIHIRVNDGDSEKVRQALSGRLEEVKK